MAHLDLTSSFTTSTIGDNGHPETSSSVVVHGFPTFWACCSSNKWLHFLTGRNLAGCILHCRALFVVSVRRPRSVWSEPCLVWRASGRNR